MYKNVLYDWFGYNRILFDALNNATENAAVLKTLKFITDYIGHYMMFPIHICILMLIVYTITHTKNRNIEKELVYIKSIIVLLATLMLLMTVGQLTKIYFSFVRPYCSPDIVLNPAVKSVMNGDYHMDKCFRSLPSGHTMYVTTFVLSMWPALNKTLKRLGVATIVSVGLTRVTLGAHFPADIVYGFLLAASLSTITRLIVRNTVMKPTLRKLKDTLHI